MIEAWSLQAGPQAQDQGRPMVPLEKPILVFNAMAVGKSQ